jgi:hypothetical protein
MKVEGLGVTRRDGALVLDLRSAALRFGAATVDAAGVHVELVSEGGRPRLRVARALRLAGDVRLREEAPREPGEGVEAQGETGEGEGALGRVGQLRAQAARAATMIDALLAPGATVGLASVQAKVRVGDDELNLGPGELKVGREEGRVVVELSPGGSAPGGTERALTFRASVPLGTGANAAAGELVADVNGGPIWLSTLGVREGDFGLVDVGAISLETRSHVALSADGRRVSVSGEGKLRGLSLQSAKLAADPVRRLELAWRGKAEAELDGSKLRVDDGEVDFGAVRLDAKGVYERTGQAQRVRAAFEVPLTACQAMLDALPAGLVPKLGGMRMAGSFAFKGRASFDTQRLDRDFALPWEASSSCRITEAPSTIAVAQFRRPFRHTIYDGEGRAVEALMGPGTESWAPYSSISKFMEVAVLTTEDGGFFRHHGFDEEAIRNSVRENLKQGRFVRGASTLSMQLAKNLYLGRSKTLSRKLQEAVLTMYLEQELTKEQILELYLNVVEFGPMLYGIGPAARHYFGTAPSGLSLGQALYLASILPSPKKQHFGAGGRVTPGYMSYLRKLMVLANKRRRITDEELESGLHEALVFGRPSASALGEGFEQGAADDGFDEPSRDEVWQAP